LPGIPIPLAKMNQDIQLVSNPGGGDLLKNDNMYSIQIKNLSENPIVFQNDYGVKLYVNKGEEWKEVENKMESSAGEVILPLAKKWPSGIIFAILPYIPNLSEKHHLESL
jgi:hypothetical protein